MHCAGWGFLFTDAIRKHAQSLNITYAYLCGVAPQERTLAPVLTISPNKLIA